MDMMTDEYRDLKNTIENLRAEMNVLSDSLNEMKRDYSRLNEKSFKDTIENEDRKLLNSVLQEVQSAGNANKALFFVAVGVVIGCLGFNFWTQWKMKAQLDQVNHNYELTTAILSGDAHYWYDGTNYVVARESPAGAYLQKVYADYQRAKAAAQQAAPQE